MKAIHYSENTKLLVDEVLSFRVSYTNVFVAEDSKLKNPKLPRIHVITIKSNIVGISNTDLSLQFALACIHQHGFFLCNSNSLGEADHKTLQHGERPL